MMDGFSAPVRKFIAIGILTFLVLAALLLLSTLFSSLDATLERLDRARVRAQKLLAVKATPEPDWPPLLEPGATLNATDVQAAQSRLAAMLVQLGGRFDVRLSASAPGVAAMAAPALLTAEIVATGDQQAVLRLIAAIERGPPLLRFQRVSMTALPSTGAASSDQAAGLPVPPAFPPPPAAPPTPTAAAPTQPGASSPTAIAQADPFAGAAPASSSAPAAPPGTSGAPAPTTDQLRLEARVVAIWSGS